MGWLPRWHSGKESACQCKRLKRWGFNPWVGKIFWRRKLQPTLVFLPGESHGQRNWQATVHGVAKSRTWLSDWTELIGLPWWLSGKEPTCRRHKRCGFRPWVGKIPWRTQSSILAWRIPWTKSLVGYSSWIHKDSNTTEMTQYVYICLALKRKSMRDNIWQLSSNITWVLGRLCQVFSCVDLETAASGNPSSSR